MRIRALLGLAIVAMVLVACGDDDKVVGANDKTAINIVKDGAFLAYPSQPIGDMAACFFGDPKWESLTGTDGNTYVNLTGDMTYAGSPVEAKVQFRVNKSAQTFEFTALEFNGVPQTQLTISALIAAMAEEC